MSRASASFSRAPLLSAAGLLLLAGLTSAQVTRPTASTGSSSRPRADAATATSSHRDFTSRGPTRYEAQILAFEAADALRPPAPGGIVFVGSSTIRLWPGLATDFPGLPVVQ